MGSELLIKKEELLKKLEKSLAGMDIPSFRRKSIHWLSRNLTIRNNQKYSSVLKLIIAKSTVG